MPESPVIFAIIADRKDFSETFLNLTNAVRQIFKGKVRDPFEYTSLYNVHQMTAKSQLPDIVT